MKHGAGGYARGCRCEECRKGHREIAKLPKHKQKQNEWRRRKRAENLEEERRKDRERYYAKRRPQMLAARRRAAYGIEPEEFIALLATQGARCAICKVDKPNGRGDWHVDHDHQTGRIRGLLCHACNVGLGNFRDSEELLMAAIAYLRRGADTEIADPS